MIPLVWIGKDWFVLSYVRKRRKLKKAEFNSIVSVIKKEEMFRELKNFQHHNSSIFAHSMSVAWLSYRICRALNLDFESAARGGLLHDFFLYDWREYKKDKSNKNHGRNHPYVALRNASDCFELNEREKDIIVKHMWPKSFKMPKYAESYVVNVADKVCAAAEFTGYFYGRVRYCLHSGNGR